MIHRLMQDYHTQQCQILLELKQETSNEDMCSRQINHLAKRILSDKDIQKDDKILLYLHKIAIIVSKDNPKNILIWSILSQKTKGLLRAVLPYHSSPHELQSYHQSNKATTSFSVKSFHGSLFSLQHCGNWHNHEFFMIANYENKRFSTYDPVSFPRDFREGLGASDLHRCAANPKEGWVILSTKPDISFKEWWDENTHSESQEEVLEKIYFLLTQEREFGIPLFNLKSQTLFHICKGRVYVSDLNNFSTEFIPDLKKRHEKFFNKLRKMGLGDASSLLKEKYNSTNTGLFEKLYNTLSMIFSSNILVDIDFLNPQSPAKELTNLLYIYLDLKNEVANLHLERFHHISSLILYLKLVAQAALSEPMDPYPYAKKLIQNIPKKTVMPTLSQLCKTAIIKKIAQNQLPIKQMDVFECESDVFFRKQDEDIAMLNRIFFSIIVKEFNENDLSIEKTIENFCNESLLINRIKNQLNIDSEEDTSLQPILSSDGVSTSGEYFEILFWQGFLEKVTGIIEGQEVEDPKNPHIDLTYARFLHTMIPDKELEIAELKLSSLKQIAKNAAKKKLASKLKSRLEKFQMKK